MKVTSQSLMVTTEDSGYVHFIGKKTHNKQTADHILVKSKVFFDDNKRHTLSIEICQTVRILETLATYVRCKHAVVVEYAESFKA